MYIESFIPNSEKEKISARLAVLHEVKRTTVNRQRRLGSFDNRRAGHKNFAGSIEVEFLGFIHVLL